MIFIESSSFAYESDLTSDIKAYLGEPQLYLAVNGLLTAESDAVALRQADKIRYRVDKEGDSDYSTQISGSASSVSLPSKASSHSKLEKKHGKLRQWFEKFRYQGELEFYLQPTK